MSKSNGETVTYEFPYMRKPKGKTSIWRGIYNPDKNYILGRTPRNWGKIQVHYLTSVCMCITSVTVTFYLLRNNKCLDECKTFVVLNKNRNKLALDVYINRC